jgi:hypothetical protein
LYHAQTVSDNHGNKNTNISNDNAHTPEDEWTEDEPKIKPTASYPLHPPKQNLSVVVKDKRYTIFNVN